MENLHEIYNGIDDKLKSNNIDYALCNKCNKLAGIYKCKKCNKVFCINCSELKILEMENEKLNNYYGCPDCKKPMISLYPDI